jgi:LPXTG-site transpeptidase (sortase) family protein
VGHCVPPPFDCETMKLPAAIVLLLIALINAACSSSSADPVDRVTAPATNVAAPVNTITTVLVEEPEAATPRRSPLASSVVALGSARYDVEDHVDDRAVPTSISIEGVGVAEAPVIDVGVEENGDMEIPGADSVGWYRFNATPGEAGSAVLAAHIAFDGQPGVFRYLDEANVGDRVVVEFDDGTRSEFEIVELAQYDKQELPDERVFAKTGDPVLTLITCGGDFNRSLRSYEDNIVGYAIPIGT